ncbi:MAG: proton-conducting membrane transporter [Lachnospiraceae bacterium]|nr:proton-conducting membrane transporter [Lachnospiraceae bacterium]
MSFPFLLIIPIILPLVGATALLIRSPLPQKAINRYVEVIACINSLVVWYLLLSGQRGSYTLFSLVQDFSISFRIDGLSALFSGMISLMWPLALLYAFSYMGEDRRNKRFFSFYLASYGITMGLAFSANLITLYLFFEMLTLSTIPLISYYEDHESLYAGRVYAAYLIGGAALAFIPATFLTFLSGGGDFLYGGLFQSELPVFLSREIIDLLYLFSFFGFGVKAAVFPLSAWLPRASAAPTPVTALLHAVAVVNSGVFAVMRLTYYSFGPDLLKGSTSQTTALLFSIFTMVWAAVMAVKERHFKRRLAYSTVSNLSYMLFGISLMTEGGLLGGLSHLVFHGIIKMSLFLCAGIFMHCTGKEYIYEINGVGRRLPLTFAVYTIGALSLIGIPGFCGFVSKWALLTAGAEAGGTLPVLGAAALILTAFLCAIYTLTVSLRAFFPPLDKDHFCGQEVEKPQKAMLIPILVFAALNIFLGLFPRTIMPYLTDIAHGAL